MLQTELIQELLQKEVSRREFLVQLGAVFLAIFGISSLLKNINNFAAKKVDAGAYSWNTYSGAQPVKSNNPLIKSMEH